MSNDSPPDFRVDSDLFNKLKRGCEDAGGDAAGRAMRGGGRGRGGAGAAKWRRVSEDQGGAGGAAGAGAGAARAGGAAGAMAVEERPKKKKGKGGGFSAVYLKPALAIFMGKDSAGRPKVVKEIKYKTLRRFGILLGRRGLPQRERRKTPDGCGKTPDGCGRLLRKRQRWQRERSRRRNIVSKD